MNEVQLRPLLLALAASLLCLYVLVIVWPRFVPPPPAPFVESLLAEIRAQNYEVVYSHLAERWNQHKAVREYVDENLKDEELSIRMGGFVESTRIESDKVEQNSTEASIPVSYRVKEISSNPPRVYERRALLRLVYERARWRLDGLKILK
jgi:hypothetical protein